MDHHGIMTPNCRSKVNDDGLYQELKLGDIFEEDNLGFNLYNRWENIF